MIAVDTSVWIEFLRGREPFFSRLRGLLEEGEVLAPECVFGELLQGAKDVKEEGLISAYWNSMPKLPVEEPFIQAGIQSFRHQWLSRGIGLVDGLLIVFARASSSRIWTLDKKLLAILEPSEGYEIA